MGNVAWDGETAFMPMRIMSKPTTQRKLPHYLQVKLQIKPVDSVPYDIYYGLFKNKKILFRKNFKNLKTYFIQFVLVGINQGVYLPIFF